MTFSNRKIIFFANTEWYLYNFRLPLALELRKQGFEVIFLSPPGRYGTKIEAEGFRWITINMERSSLNPFSEFALILKLISVYRSEKPDIVHHFTLKPVIYGSIAAQLSGIRRRVNAVAGLGYVFANNSSRARLLKMLVSLLLRIALRGQNGRTIFQNPDDQNLFLGNKIIAPESAHLILGSGVDTERFRPRSNVSGSLWFRVLMATRLIWDKGVGTFVEASKILKSEGRSLTFLLAGETDPGNPRAIPDSQIQRWRQESLVEPLGHIEDISEIFSTVDLVVLPSAYAEGVPRILLEAAASGLPLITTDTPGCREIVEHDVNGLLVPPNDAESLAGAIRYLAEKPDELARMGTAGRQKALDKFDERLVFKATSGIYKELLAERDATKG